MPGGPAAGAVVPGAGGPAARQRAMQPAVRARAAPETDMGSDTSAPPISVDQFLARCFAGLRPLQGWFIRATKRSADGKVQVRLAVETGSSGPRAPIRVRSPPAGAYKVGHHNCKDTASVTVDDVRYELSEPVSPITPISAFMGTTRLWGPLPLNDATCTVGRSSDPASEMKCAGSSPSVCP